MRVTMIGTGYVGLVTGACFARLGNDVVCADIDAEKIARLNAGEIPIYEHGLEEIIRAAFVPAAAPGPEEAPGALAFTTDIESAVRRADAVFVAVGTPMGTDGRADLGYVRAAYQTIAKALKTQSDEDLERMAIGKKALVNKSTVPVGVAEWTTEILVSAGADPNSFAIVSNPEFLREGNAVSDFMAPDRIVIGAADPEARTLIARLYQPLDALVILTDLRSAEMIKYASNAFLATKISFINEIANICEQVGADVELVARGMGADKRIGEQFLRAGLGYGGSCFPKDTLALIHIAGNSGYDFKLLKATVEVNTLQRRKAVQTLRRELGILEGRVIAVLGAAFKPDTDDLREAPAIDIIQELITERTSVRVYDPIAARRVSELFPDVETCDDPYSTARDADALVVVTDWPEFKDLDPGRLARAMGRPLVFDGRNILNRQAFLDAGFAYFGVGRQT